MAFYLTLYIDQYDYTEVFYFFMKLKLIFYSKSMKTIEAIRMTIFHDMINLLYYEY